MNELPLIVKDILELFVVKLKCIESINVKGVYLIGSTSLNDFYLNKSDIDFVILCKHLPNDKQIMQLRSLHHEIEKQFSNPKLSGAYIQDDTIYTNRYFGIDSISYNEGKMDKRCWDMSLISLMELRQNAITIEGVKAGNLPIKIDRQITDQFLFENINTYWKSWVSLIKYKSLIYLFPRITEWILLGIARQLYTLQTGKITSKTEAGKFCIQLLPPQFHKIMYKALQIRAQNKSMQVLGSYYIQPSPNRYKQTINCAIYMIRLFNNCYKGTLS